MPTLIADPQFKLYVICCSILSFQMLVLAAMTAGKRANRQNYLNPEDVKVSRKDARLIDGAEHPDVARVQRAHRNLNESLPMFFALGLLCVLAGVSPLGARICIGGFTAARLLHSVVYIKEMQPLRTIAYALGSFALIGMMVQLILAVLA